MPSRRLRMVPVLLVLLAGLGSGCGGEDEAPPGTFHLAREAGEEGDRLLEAGRREAARENHLRAYQYAVETLAEAGGREERLEVLAFLARLAVDIGRHHSSGYLGRAVRHANESLRMEPRLFQPVVIKGVAYHLSGMLMAAKQVFESLRWPVDPGPRETVETNLIAVYYDLAKRLLIEDKVGARAEARRLLVAARRIRPDPERNRLVFDLLSQHGEHYEAEANAHRDDPLAMARIHSRYGFSDPVGAEALRKAEKIHGRTLQVRWVEARYVEEMDGRPEMLERAAEHYLQLMSHEERAAFAAAGLGRVLLALGRPGEALSKIARFPEPTAELRRVLVLLRLARIEALPEESDEEEEREFREIGKLLEGDLEREIRARLLTRTGLTALLRGNRERLVAVVRELANSNRDDPRVAVLDAELAGLSAEGGGE